MIESLDSRLKLVAATKSTGNLLLHGFIVRLAVLGYILVHDCFIGHIKFTDIDYHVFTNGSRALVSGQNPYQDAAFKYPPTVALLFAPNVWIHEYFSKFTLVITDILNGQLLYLLNIYQGTNRVNSKVFLALWLFNPISIAISTRGSFEPIINLVVLASIYLIVTENLITAGLLYGFSIHVKLFPIIYAPSIYLYLIQRKPYLRTQTRIDYWIKTLRPGSSHFKFGAASALTLVGSTYLSFIYYGQDYIDSSFRYHMGRLDLQHNFSVYFYLFKLFPRHRELLSSMSFGTQAVAVLFVSVLYRCLDTNRRSKLKKLTFSLFASTFAFVSLNKVCTSQYFTWYLIFLPLILDSIKLDTRQACTLAIAWLMSQANWLLFAYLYEYHKFPVLDAVGNSSILFLLSNLWILSTLCQNFEPSPRGRLSEESKDS